MNKNKYYFYFFIFIFLIITLFFCSNNNKIIKKENIINSIWEYLSNENIKFVFGLPGESIIQILNKIPKNINWINTGNEANNGFIAQIYGYYKNQPGILFTTYGPGISTAISALLKANKESNPLLFITSVNKDANVNDFQNINYSQILKGVTKYYYEIDNENTFFEVLNKAYQIAKIKKTCSILAIDDSILNKKTNIFNYNLYNQKLMLNNIKKKLYLRNNLKNFFGKDKKTLVILGKAYNNEFEYIQNFILKNKLNYVCTSESRTFIKNSNYCGIIGTLGNHSANYAFYHADYLVIFGNISGGLTTTQSNFYENKFSLALNYENKKIINFCKKKNNFLVKNNSNIIVDFISPIIDKLYVQNNNNWNNFLLNSNKYLFQYIKPISNLEKYLYNASIVYNNLDLSKYNLHVTTGVGNHWYGASKYFIMNKSNLWKSQTIFSSIGVGFSNGLGITLATKNPVWIFEGDGGSLFSLNLLIDLYENYNNYPITINIFLDHYYSAIVSAFIMKKYIPLIDNNYNNKKLNTTKVSNINWKNIFKNSLEFFDINDYYKYLMDNPISDKLRILLIYPSGKNNYDPKYSNSNIYEINFNKDYYNNLKNSNFNNILNTELVIKSDN